MAEKKLAYHKSRLLKILNSVLEARVKIIGKFLSFFRKGHKLGIQSSNKRNAKLNKNWKQLSDGEQRPCGLGTNNFFKYGQL